MVFLLLGSAEIHYVNGDWRELHQNYSWFHHNKWLLENKCRVETIKYQLQTLLQTWWYSFKIFYFLNSLNFICGAPEKIKGKPDEMFHRILQLNLNLQSNRQSWFGKLMAKLYVGKCSFDRSSKEVDMGIGQPFHN